MITDKALSRVLVLAGTLVFVPTSQRNTEIQSENPINFGQPISMEEDSCVFKAAKRPQDSANIGVRIITQDTIIFVPVRQTLIAAHRGDMITALDHDNAVIIHGEEVRPMPGNPRSLDVYAKQITQISKSEPELLKRCEEAREPHASLATPSFS